MRHLMLLFCMPLLAFGTDWTSQDVTQGNAKLTMLFTSGEKQVRMGLFPKPGEEIKAIFLETLRSRNNQGGAHYFGQSETFTSSSGIDVNFIRYTQTYSGGSTANLFLAVPLEENVALVVNFSQSINNPKAFVNWDQLEQGFRLQYNSLIQIFEKQLASKT